MENGKMNQNEHWLEIPGSERFSIPDASMIGPADLNEIILVTLLLRRIKKDEEVSAQVEALSEAPVSQRKYLNRKEFEAAYGINPEDLKKLESFVKNYHLTIHKINAAAGTVVLSGTVGAFSKAFDVKLSQYKHPDYVFRGRTGHVRIPDTLSDIVMAVLGLDNRPQTSTHFRLHQELDAAARASSISYTPPEVARLYDFPQGVDCRNQCIGIIELGGGYRSEDISTYFNKLGIPQPDIVNVSIQGARNVPTGDPSGPDGEVTLDIEVAAAVAPGAKIAMYFAPNSDSGFLDAITTAIHDEQNKPTVISISWGAPEKLWTKQAIMAMNRAFQDAAALGVTICCASGDNGSSDGLNDGKVHVDFPSSSPYALGCGGTKLTGTGETIQNEVVWNEGVRGGATGGGVSSVFPLPAWQNNIQLSTSPTSGKIKGRAVPDVAGNADPVTGYTVLVDGKTFKVGGTSAVAPLWAGLTAIINQQLGHPVGYLNPLLYRLPKQSAAFHDIVTGNNDIRGSSGTYAAHSGWDACTGLGSPKGEQLYQALLSSTGTGSPGNDPTL